MDHPKKPNTDPLLSDQEFGDLMDAEMHSAYRTDTSDIRMDDVAKHRIWMKISTHLDHRHARKTPASLWVQVAASAAALVISVGAVTMLQRRGTEIILAESGVKGLSSISAPASVAVLRFSHERPLIQINDGIAMPDVDLVFRVTTVQPGFSGIVIQFGTGDNAYTTGHVNEIPQNPADEVLVSESGEFIKYRLTANNPALTVCAVADKTREGVQRLIDVMRSHPTPLLSGIIDPDSACASIRIVRGEPH